MVDPRRTGNCQSTPASSPLPSTTTRTEKLGASSSSPVPAGEIPVGMGVHGQPLPGVEQLHQQARIRAEGLLVLGPQPLLRLRPDQVTQQLSGFQSGEALLLLAE